MKSQELKRILLVEDARDIQLVARVALEQTGGFTVETCNSGGEALERIPVFGPDLILMDVKMPDMDGPATLRALRELPEAVSTPVVFMTANVQPQEVGTYLKMGAIGVVSKPFDAMTLSKTLRDAWEHAQARHREDSGKPDG